MLLERLEHCVGVRKKGLEWFASYLSDRTFVVSVDSVLSNVAPISGGIPQGSILSLLLFSLYLLPLGQIFSLDIMPPLFDFLEDVNLWTGNSFLTLNETKIEVIILGSSTASADIVLGPLATYQHSVVKNLGVVFDSDLQFDR